MDRRSRGVSRAYRMLSVRWFAPDSGSSTGFRRRLLVVFALAGIGGCHPTLTVQEGFVPNPCTAGSLSPAAMPAISPAEEIVIATTCSPGLTAAPVGKTPIESQSLVIDQAGNGHAILKRIQTSPETTVVPLTPETLRRIRQHAEMAFASAPYQCEPGVVDGMG